MRSASKAIWIGIGTITAVVIVMIVISYYNKKTVRELRSSIDELTNSVRKMNSDMQARTQQCMNSDRQYPRQQYMEPAPRYYEPPQQEYYEEQYEEPYRPVAPITSEMNRQNIRQFNAMTTIVDGSRRSAPRNNTYTNVMQPPRR